MKHVMRLDDYNCEVIKIVGYMSKIWKYSTLILETKTNMQKKTKNMQKPRTTSHMTH